MRNIIIKLPEMARPTLKKLIRKAFTAKSYAEGVEQARAIIEQYKESFRGPSNASSETSKNRSRH